LRELPPCLAGDAKECWSRGDLNPCSVSSEGSVGRRKDCSVTLHAASPPWTGEIVYGAVTSQEKKKLLKNCSLITLVLILCSACVLSTLSDKPSAVCSGWIWMANINATP